MRDKIYKITNNLGMLFIVASIVTYNLIVGANEKALQVLPLGIFAGLSLLLLFIKKVIYKEKLIKSKIDIAVTIFMGCLFLPLLFNTYCSLQGTIEFILKYFFVYAMYLLVRNVANTPKKVNILIATTIFSSLIIFILGFDLKNGKNLMWLIEYLDIKYKQTYRFSSTFGYSNAISIYTTLCVFLSINRIENAKKIISKIIYLAYIAIGTCVIYMSQSRLVLILYVFLLALYFIIKYFDKIKQNKRTVIFIVAVILCIILAGVIYYLLIKDYPAPYNPTDDTFKFRKNIEPNTEYRIAFDVDVTEEESDKSAPHLLFYSVNKYFNREFMGDLALSSEQKLSGIKFVTPEDVYYIEMTIINWGNKTITINHCYINGEEYVLRHKYLPHTISRLFTSLAYNDVSLLQRSQFYENCLRIAKDSLIMGHGGNTWKIMALAYEDYPYSVKESHSYFFELLISYGIVGVLAYSSIIVLLIIYLIKNRRADKEGHKKILSIIVGLFALIAYNYVFDFGMSFIVLLLTVFIYIALLQKDNKEEINIKIFDYLPLIAIFAVCIILLRANIAKYFVNDYETKSNIYPYKYLYTSNTIKESKSNDLDLVKRFIQNEPYITQNKTYKYYWKAIYNNAENLSEGQLEEYIDFGIRTFETIKNQAQIYFDSIIQRAETMIDAMEILEKIEKIDTSDKIERIKEVLVKEYNENKVFIQDYKRNCKTEAKCIGTLEEYKRLLKTVNINVD